MSRNSQTTIIKNIIYLREKHNLTKEQLSLYLDLDNSYIGKIENRQINITVEFLDKLSDFFNIETKNLFEENINIKSKIELTKANKIKNIRKRLAKNLFKLRESANLSQEELSLRLGLSISYIGRLEKASMNITLDKMILISDFFEVDPSVLLK